ncbi:hypothetical protein CALCODRAFT_502493 [Calocera cornea HHB12733]|uniref:Peptidase C14 caspase domain-containing protein n=1 Tax=Calocera cornea HHB12733 TaxID=1353952 RepID=A0A165D7R4_9BASI|nr:hypothetical protein CALCODRAFT_502493 [Calocera cornea HHB12733]
MSLRSMRPVEQPPKERRFAVLVGIRYLEHKNAEAHLLHTHEDVDLFRKLLVEQCEYPLENIRVLADRKGDLWPTRNNIIDAIKWLVQQAVDDPEHSYKLVWYYAGHGDQEPDPRKKEKDGLNEAIIPVDAEFDVSKRTSHGRGEQVKVIQDAKHHEDYIIDDELNALMAKPLPAATELMAFFDCCHSGTALDLKHEYVAKAVPWLYHRLFWAIMPPVLKLRFVKHKPKKAVASEQTPPVAPKRSQTLPLELPSIATSLNRALELAPDETVAAGVDILVSTSRWTFLGANWAWKRFFTRPTRPQAPDASSGYERPASAEKADSGDMAPLGNLCGSQRVKKPKIGAKQAWSPLEALRGWFKTERQCEYRSITALQVEAMGCLIETESIETVLHIAEYVRDTDDSEHVAADVMALGACSDDQLAPDSRSLAKSLYSIYQTYGHKLTYAELLLCLSRTAKPQIPGLSSSREMTERWAHPFVL